MVYYNFETKTLVGDEPAPIYNPKVSLGHIILHHLNKFPANVFQVCADDGIETTCGEVARLSKNFAKNLLKEGFKESDVVGIVAQNSSQVTSVIFGCFMIATPISAVNSKWDDFTVVFGITEPKIIFCDRDVAKSVKNYVESKEMNAEIVILTDEIDGFRHVSEFFAEVEGVKIPMTMTLKASETVAAMLSTSGTTGVSNSKIAQISHAQLNDSRMLYGESSNIFGFICSSFSWITGLGLLVFCALNHEKRLFTKLDFSPDLFFDLLKKFSFSHVTGTPAMFQLLQQSPRFGEADFRCIKRFIVGGLYCPIKMREEIKKKMPNACLTIVYGMTEAVTNCVTGENDPISMSVGKPFSDVQIRILLADGTFGSFSEIGEILLKKPGKPFLGYVKNPAYTSEAIDADGWFYTGDLGFVDDQLNLTIVGRKSFVIHIKSKVVFPTEIEEILDRMAGVKASCVIGIPDIDSDDQLPTAFVVKDGSVEISEKEVHAAVCHLEEFKQLSGGVFFVDSFPKSVTGKVLRYKMKEIGIELMKEKQI